VKILVQNVMVLHIEQGGVGDVNCSSCNGTGVSNKRVLDKNAFVEFMEHYIVKLLGGKLG
jgi:hypothetical protein